MGRSQRHKVHIQGYAIDDAIEASGVMASVDGARPPPPTLAPADWTGPTSPPPFSGIPEEVVPGRTDIYGNRMIPSAVQGAGAPFLTNLDPRRAVRGKTMSIRVIGANFLATSKVRIGTLELRMNYISPTEITFEHDVRLPIGSAPIRVVNDGVESNVLDLSVEEYVETFYIERLEPEFVIVGEAPRTIRVLGKGFGEGAEVFENDDVAADVEFVSGDEMTFTSSPAQIGYTTIRVKRGGEYTNGSQLQYRDVTPPGPIPEPPPEPEPDPVE